MIAIVQRVTSAKVVVDGSTVGEIGVGMLVFAAVCRDDTQKEIDWMANKLVGLRIFRSSDQSKHFDQDVKQIGGSILLISNFTVAAETQKGRRPSLDAAAEPVKAKELFDNLVDAVKNLDVRVETGQFAADMKVSLTNDGPATFIVDSAGQQSTPTS